MPPIPIYTSSPINATKASGITPKTAEPEPKSSIPTASATAAPTPTKTAAYAPAMPGATPSLPFQTPTSHASSHPPAPTGRPGDSGPPPPQPGAVPSLPGASLPPPPKAGETYTPPQTTPAPPTMTMPPQMAMPPPGNSYTPYQGTSSTSTTFHQPAAAQPTFLGGGGGSNLSHPPGYQQNANADQFTSQQRHQASMAEGHTYDGEEGVWDQAKKWATGVGGSLAAAESEVWKRINKQ
ncbi:hypothetical protein F5X68DRAFT_261480 [Plectosphaerella plurivora]|uniref:Uncharacterized protein n=1 Tax=Plectosphaerella plurivora TaxID=936078 RepID=A0A9P8VCN1_9PEZI|nr:hypothetical protein F5X68DRAFT_261480 [Plectosphaerella plurivora]